MSAPSSETTARPRASTTSCGVPSPGDDALEHLARELVVERAGVDEPLQRRDVGGRDEIGGLASVRVRDAGDLARPPLARGGGRRAGGDGRLDLGEQPAVGDVLELEVGEAPVGLQPAAACGRRLGKRGPQLLDQLGRRRDRQQVGLGEVAVVVGVGLRATRRGGAGVLVPVPRLLRDRAAGREDRRLALDLVAHGPLDRAHRVDVLGLGARAELLLAARTQRDVGVAAEVAALHARLGDAQRDHDVADRLHVGLRDLGRTVLGAEDRLRDDLDERHSRAVVVDERVLGTLDAAGRAADVRELAGILFHVRALDRHVTRVPSASSTSTEPSNAIGSSYCEIW